MWVATIPPPRGPPALDNQIVALDRVVDAGGLEPGGDRGETIALLDAQLMQARASASRRKRKPPRPPGSDIRRSSRARARPERRRREACPWRTRKSATSSPPSTRWSSVSIWAPISFKRLEKPGPQRVHHHALDHDVRPRNDQGGDDRESRRGRVARDHDRGGTQFRAADERDPPSLALGRDRDLRRRNRPASSRCGRARPRPRSPLSRPAR